MSNNNQIKNLESVLAPHIPKSKKIVGYQAKLLTKPGENYGSLLYALEVTLEAENEKETLQIVAKMCPPNEWIKKMFNTPVTFKREAGVYETIAQTLDWFQEMYRVENRTDFLPRYFGSRISLDPASDVVDDDAVILLENLRVSGYGIGNRFEGFDLKTSEAVVATLARLHSVALALKIKEPAIFKEKVLPLIGMRLKGFSDIPADIKKGVQDALMDILEKNEEIVPYTKKIREYMNIGEKTFEEGTEAREPFATICHNDFWVNNIMIKNEEDEIKVKMLDFQIVDYGSPARDLVFFLYTSVQTPVITENYFRFVQLYYKTFIETLQLFDCDISPFTFEAFEEELGYEARNSQLFHCLVMLSPIHAVDGAVKEVKDLAPEDMLSKDRSEFYEPKVMHTVLSFIKNKWL